MIYYDKRMKALLVEQAKRSETIKYGELNNLMGDPYKLEMPSERSRMGDDLGDISEFEFSQGRPLLSSIVVNINGTPGVGFYEMAQKVELFVPSIQSKKKFLEQEQEKVFKYWKNH